MTRINLVPPPELCNQHLFAEWRELTRIPNGIVSGKYVVDLDKIPSQYTVRTKDNPAGGKGHMKFFFNKLKFLYERYGSIRDELAHREMPQISMWPDGAFMFWPTIDNELWNDYEPPPEAIALSRKRIAEMMPKRPRFGKKRN